MRTILAIRKKPVVPPGTQWYIDNAIATSGNGKSWAGAWKSFSNIAWGSIAAGDIINVSGGTNGKTYTGGMRVFASGVLIRSAVDAGHSGPVTVYNDASGTQAGFFLQNVSNVTIRGFMIRTPTDNPAQTDGFYLQSNGTGADTQNIIIENNSIIIDNNNNTGHNDLIQTSWRVTNITIRNNYMEQRNNKSSGNAQGIYLTGLNGSNNRIYNNIVYMPNNSDALMRCKPTTDGTNPYGNTCAAKIYNNTFVGGNWGNIELEDSGGSTIKNNIVVITRSGGGAVFRLISDDPPAVNIDNNCYYTLSGSPSFFYHENQYLSFSQWRARGYDANGLNVNPQLVNITGLDFRIRSDSPCINAGVGDANSPTTDYAGVTRSSPPDIGAYEYVV